jgi:hypothetical protein
LRLLVPPDEFREVRMKTIVAVCALALSFGRLVAQVPIEIVSPGDTESTGYVDALKRAVLTSPTFVLKTSGPRLRVTPVVGGTVTITCAEDHNQFRGVAILMSGVPGGRELVYASVFTIGEEREAASKNLLRLYEAATTLGIRGSSK